MWYNFDVKVIQSDNEINRTKTKKWCNNVGISFKSYTLDMYTQNDGAERFGQLIIKKACPKRLLINLPHKLWKEIVAATI